MISLDWGVLGRFWPWKYLDPSEEDECLEQRGAENKPNCQTKEFFASLSKLGAPGTVTHFEPSPVWCHQSPVPRHEDEGVPIDFVTRLWGDSWEIAGINSLSSVCLSLASSLLNLLPFYHLTQFLSRAQVSALSFNDVSKWGNQWH